MSTLAVSSAVVNPQSVNWNSEPEHIGVKQEPDGVWVWQQVALGRGYIGTSRARFASFDEAAAAALSIAEAKGLPLAADVSLFIEMASPWYSGRENVEVA